MKSIISIPPNYFYACIFICIPFYFLFKEFRIIPFPYSLLGILLVPAGIWLVINPWNLFQKHDTPEDFSEPKALVTEGIYQYSRNPMYVGGVLILIGLASTTGNLLTLISPLIYFLVMNYMFCPHEEEKMENTFGEEYMHYKNNVRRWI